MATNEARALIVKDDRITNANLLDLVDGGETTLHSHAGGGGGMNYVDRGDPSADDWTSFTTNGTWVDLDCSSIVPANAVAIHFRGRVRDDATGSVFSIRENGNSNDYNAGRTRTQAANVILDFEFIVRCDANRVVEYQATNTTWTSIGMFVAGWFIPA